MPQLIHERKRNRWIKHDYSQPGLYFITICTQDHVEFFGKIHDQTMILNNYGKIANTQLLWLPENFPYIGLDEYIVMPNHIHVILVIKQHDAWPCRGNPRITPTGNATTGIAPTGNATTIPTTPSHSYNRRHNLLSKTINAFKTTASKIIHQNGLLEFIWQRSFHDSIIRNDESLQKIRAYIKNNPKNWKNDRNQFLEDLKSLYEEKT